MTPLLTVRSQSISENRVERLQRVILAAAKQSNIWLLSDYVITKSSSLYIFYSLLVIIATLYIGQRLHEMILKPPIAVGELLPVVCIFLKS